MWVCLSEANAPPLLERWGIRPLWCPTVNTLEKMLQATFLGMGILCGCVCPFYWYALTAGTREDRE